MVRPGSPEALWRGGLPPALNPGPSRPLTSARSCLAERRSFWSPLGKAEVFVATTRVLGVLGGGSTGPGALGRGLGGGGPWLMVPLGAGPFGRRGAPGPGGP